MKYELNQLLETDLKNRKCRFKVIDIVDTLWSIRFHKDYEKNKELTLSKCDDSKKNRISKELLKKEKKEKEQKKYNDFMETLEFYFRRDSYFLSEHLEEYEDEKGKIKVKLIDSTVRIKISNDNLQLFLNENSFYKIVSINLEDGLFIYELLNIFIRFYDNGYLYTESIKHNENSMLEKRKREKDMHIIEAYETLLLDMKKDLVRSDKERSFLKSSLKTPTELIEHFSFLNNLKKEVRDKNNKRYKIKIRRKKKKDLLNEIYSLCKKYNLKVSKTTIRNYIDSIYKDPIETL